MTDQIYKSRHAKLLQRILATVSVVYRPITLEELPALVDVPSRASGNDKALTEIVRLCGSFLTLRNCTIYIVHQSAKDFLLKQARDEIFPSGIEDIHRTVFSRSLRVMQETLRRDIYHLGAPGFPIDKVVLPNPDPLAVVRYSCVYWVNHLLDCDPKKNAKTDLQNGGLIDTFLRDKYLYWLETLSLLRGMSKGIASMLELEKLLEAGTETSSFIDRVRDACRFSLYHRWAIENSPLQVYTSALIFSPSRSITRSQFEKEEPEWIIQKPIVADNWSACLQTLEGHRGPVNAVAWSYDATRLASGSDDGTVKIWDTVTGQCVSTLKSYSYRLRFVTSVAWSYDTTRLASGLDNGIVEIWDLATGQCISTLEGHYKWVHTLAWSYDTTRIVSGSGDETVKIWDTATGQCISTLNGDPGWADALVWSYDMKRLASGSKDNTVKIWDLSTGRCISTLKGHSGRVIPVAWSYDTTRLASGSYDKTVKIWDPAAGQCVSTLEGHHSWVNAIAWSYNNTCTTWLASGSQDNTVKIWDPATGQCISTLDGHSGPVISVAWSYGTTRLASGSHDTTVRIWDPLTTSQHVSMLEGHSSRVNILSWSHDMTRLASESGDGTIKIWDPATGQCVSTFVGHDDWIIAIAWSYDLTRLALGSGDIKIWDPETSQCVSTLEGHSCSVIVLAWSHDTTRLASGSKDGMVKIWDPATGQCISTLEGRSGWVNAVAWSYDSTWLASGSKDIKIWDPATGQCVSTLHGHRHPINVLAWSHNSTRLASGSHDWTVRIWDPASGQCVSMFETGRPLKSLQFHKSNSNLLCTERGIFDLRYVGYLALGPAYFDRSLPKAILGYGLSMNEARITYEGENLLWLPPDYRPSRFATSGTTVAIGCHSGRVLIFKLLDTNPLVGEQEQ
ncbi:hypothetical protein VTG60DRAFT_6734 [Thermothelomyces hinnuleus]